MTIDIPIERVLNGTSKRIYQLLVDLGSSGDVIWPQPSQPFMRSPGPLVPGRTEEWHQGLHAVLAECEPEKSLVWEIDTDGIAGKHGFYLFPEGKKIKVIHRLEAELSEPDGRMLWRRLEDQHRRTFEALFDKMTRVLKR